jgi:hypothetical protein
MPLSWNEIKTRAAAFVVEWRGETNERAEAGPFWTAFLHVFGVTRRRVASFELAVKKAGGAQGFVDLFWPGVLLVEHKSRGRSLDAAMDQAAGYLPGIDPSELPRYLLVSDFERMRLRDLETGDEAEFAVADLLDHIDRFGFIAGYQKRTYAEQDPVNVRAAEKMGALHDALREAGYAGHALEVYLVRLLFCLFADDTGIFTPRGAFQALVEERTREDGSDLAGTLAQLFDTLDRPAEARMRTLDEQLAAFPYVNGTLFAEPLPPAAFDAAMRAQLLDACQMDWGGISPAIFGSMFQSVMDPDERRALGAHYTSEANILKLIGPLFLDALQADLRRAAARSKPEVARFHQRLSEITILDPACGCGNFLVVAYRELRRLEIEAIRLLYADELRRGQRVLDVASLIRVDVGQMFGLEIDEFPAQIAQVALWLTDHQMNLEVAAAFGEYFTRLPLASTPHVLGADALRADWATAWGEQQPPSFDFILGNPPFVGAKYQTKEQKASLKPVVGNVESGGLLDFVAGWFVKAARYMAEHPQTRTAFVSTNSISQGEQVGVLWNELFRLDCRLHFAHRTFRWTNEASGRAAVHVVIEGFAVEDVTPKRLFDYDDVRGEPAERTVSRLNPYLVEAADVAVLRRSAPLCDVPPIGIGNKPIDGGHYLFTPDEKAEFLEREPGAAPYFRRWIGAREFLQGVERWCLWVGDVPPAELRTMPAVMERVAAVRAVREASKSAPTQRLADTPTRFHVERMPTSEYLVVPKVSSERRAFIPIGYLPPEVLSSDLVFIVESVTRYHFGVLSSSMHMAWMRYTAGRLKSDYRYSASLVYNNFPWPDAPDAARRQSVEAAAQAVLDARAPHLQSGATLADLYDPLAMPPALVRAHRTLDRAVDLCYRPQAFPNEPGRVAFLFDRYEALTAPLGA